MEAADRTRPPRGAAGFSALGSGDMAYLVLSIPYLIAAGGFAVGVNPYAALAAED